MTFVVSLAIASMSLFVLLRQVMGNSRNLWGIAALVLVMQVLVLVWQVGGGWRYALAGQALALVSIASVGAVLGQYWVSRRGRIDPLLPPVGKKPGILPTRALLLLLVLALLVRLPWVIAPDPVGDLELAARRMAFLYHDGLAGAYRYNGDYMPLRLYLLWGLSQIVALAGGSFHDPLSPITLAMIKLPGMLADMGIIALIAGVAYRWQNQNPPSSHPPPPHPSQAAGSIRLPDAHRWFIVAAVYACSPPVWINVAWWGQVDALLVLPLVGMVLLLDHAEGRWSWLLWTVALLIKPQAIVFAPLLYVATIRQHGSRGVAQGMAIATATFALASTPLVMAGQGPGLTQAYLGSVGRFPKVTIGAYNLWYLLTGGQGGDDSTLIPLFSALVSFSYRQVGLMLVGGTALVVGAVVLRRADPPTRAHAAAVLALAFFMLPTQIHERYLFLVLPFLALCIAYNTRFVIPYSILVATATINILGTLDGFVPLAHTWITHAPLPLPMLCAVANLVVFLWLFAWLIRHSGERSYLPDARSSPQTGLDD
jgi:hypothetical protein